MVLCYKPTHILDTTISLEDTRTDLMMLFICFCHKKKNPTTHCQVILIKEQGMINSDNAVERGK